MAPGERSGAGTASVDPLTTIVCSFSVKPADIVSALDRIGRDMGVRFQGAIVVNGSHATGPVAGPWRVLQGSNSELDFSAYQEGIAGLGLESGERQDAQCFLFLNDTTFLNHNAPAIIRDVLMYRGAVRECVAPAIAGKADSYDNICYGSPWSGLPIYLSTFCFLLNRLALPAIGKVLSEVDGDLGSKDIDIDDPAWAPRLELPFKTYIRGHLSHEGLPNTWYRLKERRSDRRLISQKARAVYFEHRLSGEIGRGGIVFNCYPTPRAKLVFFLNEQRAKLGRKFGRGRRSSRGRP